jgi:hypothetical protein
LDTEARGEFGTQQREVAAEDRFEPAFGLEAEDGIARGGGGIAALEEAIHEIAEEVLGGFVEEGFVEACSEEDFVAMGEGAGDEAVTDAAVLEAVEREGDFGGAAGADFSGFEKSGREQRLEMGDGGGGAFERCHWIEGVGKLNVEIAVFAGRAGGEFGGGGVEFVEFPLRESWVEPGHAGAGGGGEPGGDDDAKSVEEASAIRVLSTIVEPENTEGEGTVDAGGRFFGADSNDGPGGLTFSEDAACVGGAEAVFEIHSGAKGVGGPAWEMGSEGPLEGAEIATAAGIAGGGGAKFRIGDEGEGLRLALAEAMGFEAEGIAAGLGRGDSADEILVVGPEVEQATAVVGGDGATGQAEIEEEEAVFKDGGVGMVGEEVVDGAGYGLG